VLLAAEANFVASVMASIYVDTDLVSTSVDSFNPVGGPADPAVRPDRHQSTRPAPRTGVDCEAAAITGTFVNVTGGIFPARRGTGDLGNQPKPPVPQLGDGFSSLPFGYFHAAMNSPLTSRPVVIGFDGTPAAERAVRAAGALLAPRHALVVVVWEAGRVFEYAELPVATLGMAPVAVDIRTAMELDQAMYDAAQQMAQRGAALAKEAGLDAQGLAVADDVTVADTLVRLAQERDAQAVVVGTHGHGVIGELLLGSTSRGVVKRAPCPVVVVRGEEKSRH
jgi:nucleotide-binding universal stress UspA family protein